MNPEINGRELLRQLRYTARGETLRRAMLRGGMLALIALGALPGLTEKSRAGDGDECEGGTADPSSAFACGTDSHAFSTFSTVVGYNTRASGYNSTAVGGLAGVFGEAGTALGGSALAGGMANPAGVANGGATAIGQDAQAGAGAAGQENATALGKSSRANALNATALGAGAAANFANSTAIGQGVATTRANQVAIGTGANTYTLAGVNSQASTNAQTGTAYAVTTDAAGNLAASTFNFATLEGVPQTVEIHTLQIAAAETLITDHENRITSNTSTLNLHTTQIFDLDARTTVNETNIDVLDGRVAALETGLGDLSSEIGENLEEARGGTALALAAAGLRYDDRPEKLSIAGGVGHFKGLTGLSFGMGYATSDTFRINAAISGVPELGDVGFSAGVSWTLN